ncbi:MAG: flippase-like domain-containing protein [Bacteroidales bacterium]|nr:flippase-like domain-containing protein [Bacteroidales bacterium]
MKESLGKIVRYAFSAALAGGLLWLSFREVNWKEFVNVLGSCNWLMVVLSMAVGFFSCAVRALRWKLLLNPVDRSVSRISCLDGVCIGRFANLAVQHIGELVRCGVVSRRGTPYDKVFGTVVVERAWDMFMLFAMLILTAWTSRERFGFFIGERVLGPISSRFSLDLGFILAALAGLVLLALWLVWRFRNRSRLCGRLWSFVAGTLDGMKAVLAMKGKGWFIILTVMLWFCFLMTSWLTIKALPTDYGLGMADALFLMLVGSVAGLVPVPGGFGAFHYIIALALSTIYGIPWEMGIIFATLSHESQTLTTILSGSCCLLNESLSKE